MALSFIKSEVNCLPESFPKKSGETGLKVRNMLRDQVIAAIEKLGTGFAENLDPDEFQNEKVKAYYTEIVTIIYRLLFLLFAEQKGGLPVHNNSYAHTSSLNALREMAISGDYIHDNQQDLWEGLKITFKRTANGHNGENGDSINAFGGQSFSGNKITVIKDLPLKNKFLLDVIYRLSYFQLNNLNHKIDYASLAIDELGAVYESLLDYEPGLAKKPATVNNREIKRGEFYLDGRGTDRKTTGAYYTDSRLVAQVVESALVPVITNALAGKTTIEEKEAALLDLKVIDIACGPGAFICAALEKLGEQLAIIRMGDEERPTKKRPTEKQSTEERPTEDQRREAKRDVLQHCIYGVDLNPMALELAKFSLWVTASMPDMSLSFLDHKLKCGNSLIGATPQLMEGAIPEEAYKAVGNDDPDICTALKKRVRKNEADLAREEYHDSEKKECMFNEWLIADTWVAAFFIEKSEIDVELYPTNLTLENLRKNQPVNPELIETILKVADQYKFFHYHLEFPEVFEKGGFDCLLGNPPWEKINLEDKEFFSLRKPGISAIKNASKRNKAIAALKKEDPELYSDYRNAVNYTNKQLAFFKESGSYLFGNEGLLNTYPLFTERISAILNPTGACGYIIPSGFFMDDTTSPLFRHFFETKMLKSIYDFENRRKIFQHVHGQYRFSIVTLQKQTRENYKAKFIFFLQTVEDITDSDNVIHLSFEELNLFNPNNKLLPAFKSQYEVDLNRKIYKYGVLKNDRNKSNEVHIHRMINMTAEAHLLFSDAADDRLPVYESKLIHQFDHRYATFNGIGQEEKSKGNARLLSTSDKSNIECFAEPRYYSPSNLMVERNEKWKWKYEWYLAYRYISSSTNERCAIASIIPGSVVSNSTYLIFIDNLKDLILHLANMNCFWFDFAVRAKVTFNFPPVILEQCPCIKREDITERIWNEIKIRVLKLSYTATDLDEFGRAFNVATPHKWNDKERFLLQCELEVIYAHLYNLEKEEIDYILETFPITKRKDINKYGNYQTQKLILHLYDEFIWVREETKKINQQKDLHVSI